MLYTYIITDCKLKNSTIRNAVTSISELFSVYLQSIQHAGKSSEIDATTGCLHVFRNFFIQYIPHDQYFVGFILRWYTMFCKSIASISELFNVLSTPHRCSQPVVTRISELFYQVYIIADLTIELTKVQIYWILHKALHVFRNFWLDYLWNSDSHRSI